MTFKRKSSNAILPRLDVPPEHEALREETPPDLKGIQYTHLPKVGGQSNNSRSDDSESIVLLPAIGEPHPYPYIISAEVSLIPTPRRRNEEDVDDASEYFLSEINFSKEFFEEFFNELIGKEISEIASKLTTINGVEVLQVENEDLKIQELTVQESKNSELVITEISTTSDGDLIELEEWVKPHVEQEIRLVVWSVINERSRLIQDDASKKLPENSQHLRSLLYSRLIGNDWLSNQEVILLKEIPLVIITNEMHLLLDLQKTMENQILVQFQDDIISQTLASLILEDSLPSLEKGLQVIEEEEKHLRPVRM